MNLTIGETVAIRAGQVTKPSLCEHFIEGKRPSCITMNSRLTPQDCKQLSAYIGHSPKEFKLLYKASRDGCSATTFHQMCDRKGPTISVGYTTNGYAFGGYVSVDFDASLENWKPDHQAFLFRLRKGGSPAFMKYPAVNAHIYNASNCGPAFGNARRLEVCFFQGGPYPLNNGCFNLNGQVTIGGKANTAFNYQNHSPKELNGGSLQYSDIEVYSVVGKYPSLLPDDYQCVVYNCDRYITY